MAFNILRHYLEYQDIDSLIQQLFIEHQEVGTMLSAGIKFILFQSVKFLTFQIQVS